MKVLVKWKKGILITVLLLMALTIYVTIGNRGDEKSKYGYTVYQSSYAVTHIDSADINIVTPKNNQRFFVDTLNTYIASEMKSNNVCFLTFNVDYTCIQEFCILPDFPEITEESTEKRITESQGNYAITSDFTHDDLTFGDLKFHRVCYNRKDRMYLDYGVAAEYFFEKDGTCIELRAYVDCEKEPNYKLLREDLCEDAEKYLKYYSFGATEIQPAQENLLWARWKGLTFAPWILLLPFLYIFLCGITFTGFAEKVYVPETKRYRFVGDEGTGWNEDFLSLSTSKMLLGFFSVLIVFHHLVQQSGGNEAGILFLLEDFGVGFVGVFFFFSGFGLYESMKKKEGYIRGFLKKRLPSVLIPFYTVIAVFLAYFLPQTEKIETKELIGWITGWKLINSHMWYIVEIVFLYIIFYLLFRWIKNRKISVALLFAAVIALVVWSLRRCHGDAWFQGEWWYNTTLLFPIGVLFAEHRDNLVYYMKRFYVILLPVILALFVIFYKFTKHALMTYSYWSERGLDKGYDDKFRCLIVQCPMVIFFVFLVLMLGLKLKIGNKALAFLGSISLELYLIHNLFFSVFSVVKGTGAFYFSVLVASLPAATLLHKVHTLILCLIYKKPIKRAKPLKQSFAEYRAKKKENRRVFCERAKRSLRYGKRNPKIVWKLSWRHLVCFFICATSVFPIILLVVNSTKTRAELVRGISLIPGGKFLDNVLDVKGYLATMGLDMYNVLALSCVISITVTLVGTYLGAMCAYGFEYFSFKHKKGLWRVVVCALMMPATAGCVGFVKLVSMLHMYNHLFPIIMAGITIPSCVYFMRMYLQTISLKEIIEAARIDGCREWSVFNRIILPIIKPAILLQLVINFANSWNSTVYQNLVLVDVRKKSISVFLHNFAVGNGAGSDPFVYTALLISTIPSLIIFLLFSNGIASRINLGSIKE